MKLTKLSAAPVRQAEVPPGASASKTPAGPLRSSYLGSTDMRGVRVALGGEVVSYMLVLILACVLQPAYQSPDPTLPVRIQGQVKEPTRVTYVAPQYPNDAARAGMGGAVVLECQLDLKGKVVDARLMKGVPPLSDAAIAAVKKWRYTPTLVNGEPATVVLTVTINFKPQLRGGLKDLLDSLSNKNEFIRESAVIWLGTARQSPSVSAADIGRVIQTLTKLREHEDSERVRLAVDNALAKLDGH